MAVLSGDTTANIQDFLACYGLTPFISWCAGSEAPPVKPDPQMVWTACETLSVRPEHCLVVGDSALDLALARQSDSGGYISVTWGGSPAIAQADMIVHHPSAMITMLTRE
jgi:phosphoglycolate phosphatase